MPIKQGKILISLLCLAFVFFLSSCTGSVNLPGHGTPHVDGNGIQGKSGTYYSVISPDQANVVLTKGKGEPARLLSLVAKKIVKEEAVPAEALSFSVDESVLIVNSKEDIFERSLVSVESVINSSDPLPPAKTSTYCKGLTGSYPELLIETNGTYQLYGITPTAKAVIGGNGAMDRVESQTKVEYQKVGFGTLSIDKTLPHPTDAQFFKASFLSGTPAPWINETNIFCHLNSNPVSVSQGNVLVSDVATGSGIISLGRGGFTDHINARVQDSSSATWDGTGLSSPSSDIMTLTGYFTAPEFALDASSVIDNVKVNCFWFGDDPTIDAEVTLVKNGLRYGVSTRFSSALSPMLSISRDYGGIGWFWGATWTAAEVNSPSFGFGVQGFSKVTTNLFSIDYCRMSVYWHSP